MHKESVLSLTVSQRRGVILLLGLVLLVGAGRLGWRMWGHEAPDLPPLTDHPSPHNSQRQATVVELNSADSLALEGLPGIGPVFAGRIMKYRAYRGGFDRKEDLLEVYGLDSARFAGLEAWIRVDPTLKPQKARRNYTQRYPAYKKRERKTPREWTIPDIQINLADSAEWEQLPGIGPVFAGRIVKYRAARDGFGNPAQLREVYGFPEETYLRLEPHLKVDSAWTPAMKTSSPSFNYARLDLNEADSVALEALPGIGPKTAGRIIRFRTQLGYFRSLEQLKEVWGMRDENFELIAPRLTIGEDFSAYPKLRINVLAKEELGGHPYLSWKTARILVAYREMHGDFSGPEDFEKIHGLDSGDWERVLPYLDFSARESGNMANLK